MSESTSLARVIVRQIIEAGITDVVISPGSRNAPLSFAFFAASQKGLIKLHTRIDERTAAFFALGLAKASGRAVPIVCTSGTAVANYHPAVLEAHHTNTPLLVLTADRPARLRKTGANQTTEQARIFGKSVRYFADVSGAVFPMELPIYSLASGPVHLNIQFEEPLAADSDSTWLDEITVAPRDIKSTKAPSALKVKSERGVLIVGHDRGGFTTTQVNEFAAQLGWPLISEDPLSIKGSIAHASLFLASTTIAKEFTPRTVIIIGRTTLSRSINIASADKQIVIDSRITTVDTDRNADKRFTQIPILESNEADSEWLEKWQKFSDRTGKELEKITEWSEPVLARTVAAKIKDGTTLFVSSSRPIRDIEAFASARTGVETLANRGLAGIDGNISTAMGIATARTATIAVLGDLSFLHDLTGLIHSEKPNLLILVVDNNGGGIFSTLTHRGSDGFESIFGTPHNLDLAAIASALNIKTSSINSVDQLNKELAQPIDGVRIVIAQMPDRESNADLLKQVHSSLQKI
ncbi:MAG: 2-succinyl-5-enolpyruvyl-6-hydroxy-3-cyclohexene-1-carboxylic-acid synthase [Actinobacteria bacterium]|nr:2-succinyl-5-enolpyruvyl-6-hydroxy-3-cyclohexene-1-carboxylic-acid synthase [Actinomycetota bacterium]